MKVGSPIPGCQRSLAVNASKTISPMDPAVSPPLPKRNRVNRPRVLYADGLSPGRHLQGFAQATPKRFLPALDFAWNDGALAAAKRTQVQKLSPDATQMVGAGFTENMAAFGAAFRRADGGMIFAR